MSIRRPPPIRETELLRQCLTWLALQPGYFVWRQNSGAVSASSQGRRRFVRFNGAAGCSDIIGLAPGGRFLAIETKRPGNKPTAAQASFLEAVGRAGGIALVIHSLDELMAALPVQAPAPRT